MKRYHRNVPTEALISHREQGLTSDQIGELYGISGSAVRMYLSCVREAERAQGLWTAGLSTRAINVLTNARLTSVEQLAAALVARRERYWANCGEKTLAELREWLEMKMEKAT